MEQTTRAYKVESGIPMPSRKAHNAKFPFKEMQVGDSFLVPFDGEDEGTVRSRIASNCTHQKRRIGRQYATRKVDGGIRVWRVK